MPARELGILVALGATGIVVLVVIGWRAVSCRRGRARSRPASPEDAERRRALHAIAAATYAKQTRHDEKGSR